MVMESTDVGNAISRLGEDISADIIAMASRPRERLTGLTLGHVVDSIQRTTTVPLLLKNPLL